MVYDAIIIDVRMPGLSGPDVFEALRASGSPVAERAIFVCADIDRQVHATLARLGCPVLAKPFSLREVAAALDTLS